MSKSWRSAVAASLCAAALGISPAIVVAAPAIANNAKADLAWSDSVDEAAAVVRGLSERGVPGYTGMSAVQNKRELRVLWKEPVPGAVAAFDGQKVAGLTVRIVPAKFSEEELVQKSEQLLAASQAGTVAPISYVYGADDGSGLVIGVDPAASNSLRAPMRTNDAQRLTGLPVTEEAGVAPGTTGRQNDSDPWYGGGMMEAPGFVPPNDLDPYLFCSNAFAVLMPDGYGRLLGARHCDDDGNLAWKNGAHSALTNGGADVDIQNTDDTMLIDPIGGTGGYVHGGPWNATSSNSRYHLKVASAGSAVQNQSVCTSGANSGEHCGLIVNNATILTWTCANGGTCHGWRAGNSSSTVASNVGGDSGGPVYQNRSDGRVNARGVIYGGDTAISCGNVRFGVSNCYAQVWFTDITRVTALWGVKIETVA
ncbi:hypothetical protein HDA40_002723 [Hamadaea flava]|uniref:S1 family peptidase n=1 Tax=Hamadaea flava TaxID=1742688 RepID=A0ABV8LHG6_9ACTN|nr:S1 family peptidase [Hamadaea flava]MCP2324216.1 hypothetical protein [Hamadaea flava]